MFGISIHAAREGGDHVGWICGKLGRISIHAAREGGDDFSRQTVPWAKISIHAAREGGDAGLEDKMRVYIISIHAAREGGDLLRAVSDGKTSRFQSTPPVKAATLRLLVIASRRQISIHAAREGGDFRRFRLTNQEEDFNPRRP